ncbi:MAG: tyrosine-type recombinase/integrase [Clostridiaceae bacterium]
MSRYSVEKGINISQDEEERIQFYILDNDLPDVVINRWLEIKGSHAILTMKKYAFILCSFLNYIDNLNINYKDVKKKHILFFIDHLIFNKHDEMISYNSSRSYNTIANYISIIKEFYRYLEDLMCDDTPLASKKNAYHKQGYLYGQVWDIKIEQLLYNRIPRIRACQSYIKWYKPEEIDAIISQFTTLRDKAIFLLTLEGMRIGEVINVKSADYSMKNSLITLTQTKGGKHRIVPLREYTINFIENYIFSERSISEEASGKYSEYLFINLIKGKSQGNQIGYRSILGVIKRAGKKAGLPYEEMRTHSGRSTRTMELIKHQYAHPEDNITDEQIRMLMGWSSPGSIKPYINTRDKSMLVDITKRIEKTRKEAEENNGKTK